MIIKIITDGNKKLGLGHIYQSITFAKYLIFEKRNINIEFITKSSNNIQNIIKANEFKVSYLSSDGEIFNYLSISKPDIIIFDKLNVSPSLAKEIKQKLKIKLVIFTNLTKANIYADISIIADYGSNFVNKKIIKDNGQISYFGPKYWILRPEFLFKTNISNNIQLINTLLLIFGGSDPQNYSTLILRKLLQENWNYSFKIILGNAFRHNREFNLLVDNKVLKSDNIEIFRNTSNVAEIMKKSDLIIASPGLSLFEALSLGKPAICFHQNAEQFNAYKGYITTYGIEDVHKITNIIHSQSFIFPESDTIKNMEIGKGKDEIVKEVLK